jgi:hypothetical protein
LFSLWIHAWYLAGYDQQDAHEFFVALLDGIDTHALDYHGEKDTTKSSADHDLVSI